MSNEQQVASLELSKKLEELGVEQNSLFGWSLYDEKNNLWGVEEFRNIGDEYSAFTVAELGEMLPEATMSYKPYNMKKPEFYCERHHKSASIRDLSFSADTEANARAKMLIYLIENK